MWPDKKNFASKPENSVFSAGSASPSNNPLNINQAFDTNSHSGVFSATAHTDYDCNYARQFDRVFCDGLPSGSFENCVKGLNQLADACSNEITSGAKSFNFNYMFRA